ncbi:MAG: sulfurtransferase [Acidobacteria bacterium]|nr:sulfurtransferase [Acidobacteriota bacterium]
MHSTLIRPADLAPHLADPRWVIVDCRFDLANPSWGEEQYVAGHIPGARYAHLDRHLSGTKTGTNGRHPLPTVEQMATTFGALGIAPDTQVVAYDADSGMYAARLWWMLRFLGHDAVAVLDGGFARWLAEGGAVQPGRVTATPTAFSPAPRSDWRLTVDEVAAGGHRLLVDARAPERFRGMNETLDPVAGHIPGARNYFFQQNLTGEKTFKPAAELRAQWEAVLQGQDPKDVVMYCGSGVTACHNLLAMEVSGLTGSRIFPGSWSEWCADPTRPVET